MKLKTTLSLGLLLAANSLMAQNPAALKAKLDAKAESIKDRLVMWRRDFHENPELSNREFRTSEKVATHLKMLGLEVQTGIAKTGVVGILKGSKPGPCIALRADMDGLPVKERVDIPFASKATGEYNGDKVPIMHACGHDAHTAILMGVAEILTGMKSELKGTIKFIFQPAEEGAPMGEKGGASVMVEEGVLENPKVEAIFGLHISSGVEVGKLAYRPGGTMASSDMLMIKVKGKQAHGAYPWMSVDPIVTASQIVMGLQTTVSRQIDLTKAAAVVTIGKITGGVRNNIIPEEVNMVGTIRALDPDMQDQIHESIKRTAENIAESQGAKAEVNIIKSNPVTYNDPALTELMVPSLEAAAGKSNVKITPAWTGAEDFAWYQKKIPGLFYFLGGKPKETKMQDVPAHHTPDFYIDEGGFVLGVKSFCHLVVDYPEKKK
jgi:amidohydrolase